MVTVRPHIDQQKVMNRAVQMYTSLFTSRVYIVYFTINMFEVRYFVLFIFLFFSIVLFLYFTLLF
jgi:hypothetical protein